jgi:hypothetical protein
MVIGIVEVRPKNSRFDVQECEIALPGFEVFHNLDRKGRGICLYVRRELKLSYRDIETDFEECVFVDCKLQDESMTIGLVYRSPSSIDTNNLSLNTLLKSVSDTKPQNLLILGDFNFPEIEWDGNV